MHIITRDERSLRRGNRRRIRRLENVRLARVRDKHYTASRVHLVDRSLECCRIVGDTITNGTIVEHANGEFVLVDVFAV